VLSRAPVVGVHLHETGRAEVYVQSFPPGRGNGRYRRSGGGWRAGAAIAGNWCFVEGEGKVRFYSAPVRPLIPGWNLTLGAHPRNQHGVASRNELFHPQPGWPALWR